MTSVRLGWHSLPVTLLSVFLTCSACTSSRQVSLSPAPSSTQLALEAGRGADILLRGGEKVSGEIVAVDDNSLTLRSKSGSIRGLAFEDMESLSTSRLSQGRTIAAVIGGVLAATVAIIVYRCKKAMCDSTE
jgi:hypothetical protein